jgi:hypothetical protein
LKPYAQRLKSAKSPQPPVDSRHFRSPPRRLPATFRQELKDALVTRVSAIQRFMVAGFHGVGFRMDLSIARPCRDHVVDFRKAQFPVNALRLYAESQGLFIRKEEFGPKLD